MESGQKEGEKQTTKKKNRYQGLVLLIRVSKKSIETFERRIPWTHKNVEKRSVKDKIWKKEEEFGNRKDRE